MEWLNESATSKINLHFLQDVNQTFFLCEFHFKYNILLPLVTREIQNPFSSFKFKTNITFQLGCQENSRRTNVISLVGASGN